MFVSLFAAASSGIKYVKSQSNRKINRVKHSILRREIFYSTFATFFAFASFVTLSVKSVNTFM